jgi:hypothetical protein
MPRGHGRPSPELPDCPAMKTLAFRQGSTAEKTYFVLLHTAAAADEAEWQAYVHAVRTAVLASATEIHVFIATDGGGPDAAQRRDLAAVVARGSHDTLTHVFTNDAFVRAVVAAFRWIAGARAFAYAPLEFSSVCGRCGFSHVDILKSFADVQESLPRVTTLRRIVEQAPRFRVSAAR